MKNNQSIKIYHIVRIPITGTVSLLIGFIPGNQVDSLTSTDDSVKTTALKEVPIVPISTIDKFENFITGHHTPLLISGVIKVAVISAEKIVLLENGKSSNTKCVVECNGNHDTTHRIEGANPQFK